MSFLVSTPIALLLSVFDWVSACICIYVLLSALSEEAKCLIAEAFSSYPDKILSEAFKLKLRAGDLASLKGLNWLNDEVCITSFYIFAVL